MAQSNSCPATGFPSPGIPYDDFMVEIVRYFYHDEITSIHAYDRARLAVLDSLGCAVETYTRSAQCRAMIGPVVPGTHVPNGCRLPGTSFELDPVKASFDLGCLIRYLDHNDGYIGREWGHPSDMLGAILSIADWKSRSSTKKSEAESNQVQEKGPLPFEPSPVTIKDLLTVTIKAYEVHCLFQHTNSFNVRGLDHTILVKVGAVVAVSWLIGLSEHQALAALSQVYQDGGPLRTYRQAPNTGPRKGWAAGDACMRATHLALLTSHGQPGAPTVLTDSRWGFFATLCANQSFTLPFAYANYGIEHMGFKLIPVEGHGISACNAAKLIADRLRRDGKTDVVATIQKISIRTMKPAITIINKQGPLRNHADRDHCLSYIVAVTLLKNDLPDTEDFADESPFANNSEVDALRDVIDAYEDPQLTEDYHNPEKRTLTAGLTVTLSDGEVWDEVLIDTALGNFRHPDTPRAVLDKFRKNMLLAFGPHVADEAISAIEDDSLCVSDFIDLFWTGDSTSEP